MGAFLLLNVGESILAGCLARRTCTGLRGSHFRFKGERDPQLRVWATPERLNHSVWRSFGALGGMFFSYQR